MPSLLPLLLLLSLLPPLLSFCTSFLPPPPPGAPRFRPSGVVRPPSLLPAELVPLTVLLPPASKGISAQLSVAPLRESSSIVVLRAPLPFDLDAEPRQGLAVVTKDSAYGALAGDVLRYCSFFEMGLPRGDGMVTTAASFAGGVSWQCGLKDVGRARSWEEVVEALVSNTPQRTDDFVSYLPTSSSQ